MTRRGATPYLQRQFTSTLAVLRSSSDDLDDWVEVETRQGDATWDDWDFNYLPFQKSDVARLRISVESIGATGLEPYVGSGLDVAAVLRCGLLLVATESRRREFVEGHLMVDASDGRLIVRCQADFVVSDLAGVYKLEPVVVTAQDVTNPGGMLTIACGTIVGSTNRIVLKEPVERGLFGDLFEFTWKNFAEDPDLEEGQLFDLVIGDGAPRPRIVLNENLPGFHKLMDVSDPERGRPSTPARIRRAVDTVIAGKVLEESGAMIVQRIRENITVVEAESADVEFDEIFELLPPQEREILEAYLGFFAVYPHNGSPGAFCSYIAELSSHGVAEYLTSVMPRQVRLGLDHESAVGNLVDLAFETSNNGGPS